jgi:hypothetical protein
VNSSRRENTSLTGRRAARASAATWASKWGSHLPPKPPPRSHGAARREGHLRGRPDRDVVALPLCDHGVRLDRGGVRHVGDVAAADDHLGAVHRAVGIALDDRRARRAVARADDVLARLVGLPARVDERGAVGERQLGVGDRGELLALDLDERGGVRGDLGRQRGDRGDDLALEAHDVLREQGAVGDERPVQHVRDVRLGDHREHAGDGARLRGVDAQEARVRERRVHELRVQHAGEGHVGRVAAEARHLVLAVRPDERPALRAGLFDRRHTRSLIRSGSGC